MSSQDGHVRYQHNFSRIIEGMYDASARTQKAAKVVAVLSDFLGKRGLKMESAQLLDIGCSTGILSTHYAQHFGSVTGVDIDAEAVAHAAKTYPHPRLRFVLGDSMRLPFSDDSFDVATCTHIYEHVPDSSRLMSEIRRVLKPGGCCFFSAGNRFQWTEPHYQIPLLSVIPKPLAHHYMRWMKKGHHYYETHLSYWGLKRLVSGFELTDYTVEVVRDPTRFAATDMLQPHSLKQRLVLAVLKTAYWICPTYIWVLRKPAA